MFRHVIFLERLPYLSLPPKTAIVAKEDLVLIDAFLLMCLLGCTSLLPKYLIFLLLLLLPLVLHFFGPFL